MLYLFRTLALHLQVVRGQVYRMAPVYLHEVAGWMWSCRGLSRVLMRKMLIWGDLADSTLWTLCGVTVTTQLLHRRPVFGSRFFTKHMFDDVWCATKTFTKSFHLHTVWGLLVYKNCLSAVDVTPRMLCQWLGPWRRSGCFFFSPFFESFRGKDDKFGWFIYPLVNVYIANWKITMLLMW